MRFLNLGHAWVYLSCPFVIHLYISDMVEKCVGYFTFSKSTIIHYQCVSTGCCVYVARIKISIDNQYVTKFLQRCDILPEQLIEKTYKAQICHILIIILLLLLVLLFHNLISLEHCHKYIQISHLCFLHQWQV